MPVSKVIGDGFLGAPVVAAKPPSGYWPDLRMFWRKTTANTLLQQGFKDKLSFIKNFLKRDVLRSPRSINQAVH